MNSKDLYIFIWLYKSNPNCAPKLVATSQNFLTYIKSIYRGWFDIGIQDTVKSLKLSNKFRKEVVIPECIKTLFYSVILERRVEKRRFIICTSVPFNTLFGFSSFHYIVQETIFFLRGFEPKTWRTQVHASQNLIPPFQDRMQETRNLYI